MQDKIKVNFETFTIDSREAKVFNKQESKLEGAIDMNLDIKYFYSKVLHGYLKFNTILGNNYKLWNNYPSFGFNVRFGVSYSFH